MWPSRHFSDQRFHGCRCTRRGRLAPRERKRG
jgi:hypothetical protein